MTATEHPNIEPPEGLAYATRTLFGAGGVATTLESVVYLAKKSFDGGDYVGALLTEGANAGTGTASDSLATELERLQLDLDEGPTTDVITRAPLLCVDELDGEERWLRFAPEAVRLGIRSLLAFRLTAGKAIGALTLYSRSSMAFGVVDRARALSFADVAAHALSVAYAYDEAERRLEGLQRALATRELIGQAQGILMERERVSPDQAFDILRIASQRLNVKLLEVAHRLVETGESPFAGHLLRLDDPI